MNSIFRMRETLSRETGGGGSSSSPLPPSPSHSFAVVESHSRENVENASGGNWKLINHLRVGIVRINESALIESPTRGNIL